jgi:cytosine/uracil/thiamine/allantoin permease
MTAYESFLFFIGSVFVPLFGIFIADHFVLRRGRVDTDALYQDGGRYGGFRVSALIPWAIGFFVFHWINPSPLTWWVELFTGWFGEPLSTRISWLPGSLPAFVASFAATIIARRISPNEDREVTP